MYCTFEMPANSSAVRYILRDLAKYSWDKYRAHRCCALFEAAKMEIPIVPPTAKKTMGLGRFAQIWDEARRQIACADVLVIMGYSLNPSDEDVRELLTSAISYRRSGRAEFWVGASLARHGQGKTVQAAAKSEKRRNHKRPPHAMMPLARRTLKVIVVNPSKRDRNRYRRFFATMEGVDVEYETCGASDYLKRELATRIGNA